MKPFILTALLGALVGITPALCIHLSQMTSLVEIVVLSGTMGAGILTQLFSDLHG